MRTFIAVLSLSLALAAGCGPLARRAREAPRPARVFAVWPHSDYKPWQSDVYARDPGSVLRELDWMKEVGINTYFPMAFSSGRVNWPSATFPDTRDLYGGASPLERAVRGGDERGIATQLYFIMGFVGFREDPWAAPDLRAHPEWDLVDLEGKGTLTGEAAGTRSSWGTFLWWDLGHPGVQARLLSIIEEALDRFPAADGVHLDYIRGAHNGGCFSESCLTRFQRATGLVLPDSLAGIPARARFIKEHHDAAYVAWRAGEITAFLGRIRTLVRRKRPELPLTAAVFGGAEGAYKGVFQDWRRWAAEGLVDAVYPMYYNLGRPPTATEIGEYVRTQRAEIERRAATAGARQPAVLILGVQTAPYDTLPPALAEANIRAALDAGAAGVGLQMLPYWWNEQYAEFRKYYRPRSDGWPPLWRYEDLLRQLFEEEG